MIQNIESVWLFLLRITESAPLGFWTLFISTVFPACFGPYLRRGLPQNWHSKSRDFIVETVALLAGIGLAWLPWQTLEGLLVGIMGGFMSPYLTLGWQALTGLLSRYVRKRLGLDAPLPLPRDPKP